MAFIRNSFSVLALIFTVAMPYHARDLHYTIVQLANSQTRILANSQTRSSQFTSPPRPHPRFQCRLCKKYCKALDKVVKCEDCEKRFHTSCAKPGVDELLQMESGSGSWYYTNCNADCGLCNGAVLKDHKAVQCDICKMRVHNGCSFITESQYKTLPWICPKYEFFNFSDSVFDDQLNLETQNRFDPVK